VGRPLSSRPPQFVATASVLVLISSWPLAAQAAEGDTHRARALFDEAGELERQGQWSAAESRLRVAMRLRETPQLHFALGWALENEDKLLEARAEYEIATRSARDRAGADEVLRLANARLTDLEKKVPILRVRVSGAGRASAHVIVDGRDVRVDDDLATAPVNPGSHVVRIEHGADRMTEEVVYLSRSTTRTVVTDVGDAGPERDPTQRRRIPSIAVGAPVPRDRTSRTVPWVLLAGGVGMMGGGAALLVSAGTDGDGHEERQRNKEMVGYAIGGAGLIGATVGAILLLRSEKHGDTVSTQAAPQLVRGGALATATVRF
jgi:hypothetical protein